jgi:hypothetical protein
MLLLLWLPLWLLPLLSPLPLLPPPILKLLLLWLLLWLLPLPSPLPLLPPPLPTLLLLLPPLPPLLPPLRLQRLLPHRRLLVRTAYRRYHHKLLGLGPSAIRRPHALLLNSSSPTKLSAFSPAHFACWKRSFHQETIRST